MPTITLNITGDEQPDAVTLLTLTRADTGAAVTIPGGGVFTQDGTEWTLEFTAPATGLHYDYTFRLTWDDGSHNDAAGGLDDFTGESSYSGRYTTLEEISTFLDSLNYTVHTDADRDGDTDIAAAVQGHKSGEARVDLYTGGPWTFQDTAAGTVVAALFNRWAYVAAAYDFASKRGFSEGSENEFRAVMDEAIAEMERFSANPMAGADGPDPDDDETPPAGTFQFVTINRGVTCDDDE